jgi:hypothetical protein
MMYKEGFFSSLKFSRPENRLTRKLLLIRKKSKATFDKGTKKDVFNEGDLVLRWDARREDKAKHRKFDNLWYGPFRITKVMNNNTFLLHNLDNTEIFGGPVNGRFLKNYFI